ncbi:tail fiber assembly protein [Mixta calida]
MGKITQYGLWLVYLDALSEVDVNLAPDIKWPEMP